MTTGYFYFINDLYYEKFDGCGLMGNKESGEDGKHGRPCFYCFEQDGYYWMMPISSRIQKYKDIYDAKMEKYDGKFDGIRFGYVNGNERAFLIQNVCPVTDKYIESEYRIQNNTVPVTIDDSFARELKGLVRKVIRMHKQGKRITLTDISKILKGLNEEQQ